MTLHTKIELENEFGITSEVPLKTHRLIASSGALSFISYSPLSDYEREVNLTELEAKNSLDNIINKDYEVRVIDYNMGANQEYAEIEFFSPQTAFKVNGSLISGRTFIKQAGLQPLNGVKDFDRTFDNNSFAYVLNDFSNTLKENQITEIGVNQWQSNFKFDPSSEVEWLSKIPEYSTSNGTVFYSKKLASYCVSVLTAQETYSDITKEILEDVKNKALKAICEYLNLAIPTNEKDIDFIKSVLYYDLATIVDINSEQTHEEQKIKFLVAVKHRHVAPFINKYSNAVGKIISAFANYLKDEPNVQKAIESLVSGGSGSANSFLNAILDNTLTQEQRRTFDSITDPNFKELLEQVFTSDIFKSEEDKRTIKEKYDNFVKNNPELTTFFSISFKNVLNNLLPVGNNFDIKVDVEDPFIYVDLTDIELTRKKVNNLSRFLEEVENTQAKEYLKNHEITPAISFSGLGTSAKRLIDDIYQYSLNKITTKESISEEEAARLINGFAIYLNADVSSPDNFFAGLKSDIPDYFTVFTVQVIYNNTEKNIFIGSSKKNDFDNISGLSDRTLMFLMYSINYIFDEFITTSGDDYLDSKIKETKHFENFLSKAIFPYRTVIFKPTDEDTNTLDNTGKCLLNQWKSLKDELATNTLGLRRSLYRSSKSFAKTKAATANGFARMIQDIDENAGSIFIDGFLFTMLGNININVLIASLVECLRKKGVPIELLLKIYEIIKSIFSLNFNLLCLLPPIKLPKLPVLELNFEIPVVDIMGALYEGLLKTLKDLFNNLILEAFKLLLDQLLDCEGAFEGTSFIDGLFNSSINSRPGSQKNLDGSPATPQQAFSGSNSITETSVETNVYSYFNNTGFIVSLIPEYSLPENKNQDLIKETKILIEKLSNNLTTPEYLNLLTGRPSRETEIFIRDTVIADPLLKTLFESKTLLTRQGMINVFTKLASLLDQNLLMETAAATTQIITDVNALCADQQVESVDEALFLSMKFGQSKVTSIKRKITENQIKTISIMERLLNPNGFSDLIPPIKCRINPDGTITPGLLPSEPHPSEIYMAERGVKVPFDILKKTFNRELNTEKLAYVSTVSVPKARPVKMLKKMYPDALDESGDRLSDRELLNQRGLYYEDVVVLNNDLKNVFDPSKKNITKTIDPNTSVETVSAKLIFQKPDFNSISNNLNNPVLTAQLDQLDDTEKRKIEEVKRRLASAQSQIELATSNFKNELKFTDGIPVDANTSSIKSILEIQHTKLLPNGSLAIINEQQLSPELQKLSSFLIDVSTPSASKFNYSRNKKTFTKLLYYNNVVTNSIGATRQLPPNFTIDKIDKIYNVYSQIYDTFEKTTKDSILTGIINSPLFKTNPADGKPNILYLPLESKQSDYCISIGKPDTHLLRLEEEKKNIINYFKKYKCFDQSKPKDGKLSEILTSLERGTLNSYIDIFFKISIYDFYLRGIFVYNQYRPEDTETKLMIDFLYNIFINDKSFAKLKKITKNNKFIIEYYNTLTNKKTGTAEEAYRFLIEKNLKVVIPALNKKLNKAGYNYQEYDPVTKKYVTKFKYLYDAAERISPLDSLLQSLAGDILTVEDNTDITKKQIFFEKDDLIIDAYKNYFEKRKSFLNLLEVSYQDKVSKPFFAEASKRRPIQTNSAGDEQVSLSFYKQMYLVLRDNNLLKGVDGYSKPIAEKNQIAANYYTTLKDILRNENLLKSYNESAFRLALQNLYSQTTNNWIMDNQEPFLSTMSKIYDENPTYRNMLISSDYFSPNTKNQLMVNATGFFGVGGKIRNFNDTTVKQTLKLQKTLKLVDDTVAINSETFTTLTTQQLNKLKTLNYASESDMTLESFFINFKDSEELKNLSDAKIGAQGYSSGGFIDINGIASGKGLFLNVENEFSKFYAPQEILGDTKYELPLQELKDAYAGLKNLCTKPFVKLSQGENRTILLRQKRPSGNSYRYYIANIYGINGSTADLDPNNAYTFSYKKEKISTESQQVILTVFAKVNINQTTFILDKNNPQNKTVMAIFEDLFQQKKEFVFYAIAAMCQTSLMKDNEKIFNNSKRLVLKSISGVINNGYDYFNENNEDDEGSFELSVFIKAALALPPVIIKGIAEAADPNIAFTSKISLAVKMVKEFIGSLPVPPVPAPNVPTPKQIADQIPEIPVPFLSLPLGFTFPFLFTPLTIAYLALCGFSIGDEEDFKNQTGNSTNTTVDVCEVE
jgi:hypothetical protein